MMARRTYIYFGIVGVVALACYKYADRFKGDLVGMAPLIRTAEDVIRIFPRTPAEVKDRSEKIIETVRKALKEMSEVPEKKRTFSTIFKAYDQALGDLRYETAICEALVFVSPDALLRQACKEAVLALNVFRVDQIQNKELYGVLKPAMAYVRAHETLNAEESYYLDELAKFFKRNGLDLSQQEQEEVKKIKKELARLEQEFELVISQDSTKRGIDVVEAELAGLEQDFIKSLPRIQRDSLELRRLGVDYPTYTAVMENCSVENTRKALWKEFVNRGYPDNEQNLQKLIQLRKQLAHKLGYKSYAHYDIDSEMAHNPETVETFLKDIENRSFIKAQQEIERYKHDLPPNISLTEKGLIKPWDFLYIKTFYKKKHYNLDDRVVAEYFPMESTLQALIELYETFLDIRFKPLTTKVPWHEDVQMVQVLKQDGSLVGYLMFDLFPRPDKYTHACQTTLIPTLKREDGTLIPGACLVIANFPKPQSDKPSLLHHHDVVTFFHEFGHALHGILGGTELMDFSGTNVKLDFVEMPSQMLEEWMWDKEIIKRMSRHYISGNPLPDHLIDTLVMLKNFDSGDHIQRQLIFSCLSLGLFCREECADVAAYIDVLKKKFRPYIECIDCDHFVCAFGHLTGYSARYYSYLWSKVFALDLFDYIKKRGLLNAEMGRRYVNTVLSKGGSQPPEQLLQAFLGRQPNSEAFFKDLGFDDRKSII